MADSKEYGQVTTGDVVEQGRVESGWQMRWMIVDAELVPVIQLCMTHRDGIHEQCEEGVN